MVFIKRLLCLFGMIVFSVSAFSQLPEGITPENKTFDSAIKSMKLRPQGMLYGHPIIKLQGTDRLYLDFDDLESESRYLKYTFIHCTHDWKVTGMNQIEYIEGYTELEIYNSSSSFNTIQHYTHYSLTFPTDDMKITKSGNYVLYVYDDTPDNPLFIRRFMVVENTQASIDKKVHAATDVSYMYTKQEIDFVVYTSSYAVSNPGLYLKASIVQNGRWDNAIIGLRYRFGKPGEYSFDYDHNENVMNGGAEFRVFDIKSLRYNSTGIVSIGYKGRKNQAYLLEDVGRPFGAYESNTTLRGWCYYKNDDFTGDNNEDYVYTHFALRSDFPLQGGDIYVFGELTDWQLQEEAKLVYNPESAYWETSLYLKQGFYNYQYVYVKDGTDLIDETYIEGSHWQTDNDYLVLVYLQDEGTVYDKLIGVSYYK